ncbi:MAG: cupin domain-containing protein [Gammaproteobacteria bacterium]|nr:cupin domain-containing protein [Gammaproteobacteria bacterium]NVK88441.1 cupin domain-containing protein [Gammaproteobacteria bacterium]
MNTQSAVNLHHQLAKITEHWSPRVIAQLNDYYFKLVKVKGDFVWHSHEDTDEAFLVLEGQLTIKFREYDVELKRGELFVVPRGVEHCPVAADECSILIIEPRGVVNTGAVSSDLTAATDQWI